MKKLIILFITVTGVFLVGCKNSNYNALECEHNPSCKTFREHNLLVLNESQENHNYTDNSQEYNNYNLLDCGHNPPCKTFEEHDLLISNESKQYYNYSDSEEAYYRVITGSYENKENANKHIAILKSNNIDCFISETIVNGKVRYRIVTGSFSNKDNAQTHANFLNELGYETFISEYTK